MAWERRGGEGGREDVVVMVLELGGGGGGKMKRTRAERDGVRCLEGGRINIPWRQQRRKLHGHAASKGSSWNPKVR